jgi:transcription initiation factor TFIIF subunit beta
MADEGKYTLETARADKSVWLMKCPPVVTRSWQAASAAAGSSGSTDPTQNPIVAKVVLSLDLLNSDESSSMQVQSSFTFFFPFCTCDFFIVLIKEI